MKGQPRCVLVMEVTEQDAGLMLRYANNVRCIVQHGDVALLGRYRHLMAAIWDWYQGLPPS